MVVMKALRAVATICYSPSKFGACVFANQLGPVRRLSYVTPYTHFNSCLRFKPVWKRDKIYIKYACANEIERLGSYKVCNLQERMPAISRKPNREMLR